MANILKKIFGGPIRLWTDMRDGTHAPQVIAHPPFDLLTDGGNGPSRRVRVDSAQTGFFAGREARTFRALNIAAGSSQVIKAVVPVNTILMALSVEIVNGDLTVETVKGGSPGGSFDEPLPIIPTNLMSTVPAPTYSPQVTLHAGGSHSGGTVIDILRVRSEGLGSSSQTVGANQDSVRGVAADTYYFRLSAAAGLTSVDGVLHARWEERPEGVY